MRAESAAPASIALVTAKSIDWIRASRLASAGVIGAITCQPIADAKACHCAVSAASISTIAAFFSGGACEIAGCARTLIAAYARTDFLSQLLNFLCSFYRGEGEYEAILPLQGFF